MLIEGNPKISHSHAMLIFSSENIFFRRVGLWLSLAQFLLFIYALPPLQSGIWLQTEQVIYAVFLFGCAAALWCLWGITTGSLICRPLHPLWLCMLAWTGWQVVATLFAPSPWCSWFGSPETGEGVAWYVALGVLMMQLAPLWQIVSYRRILLYAAASAILLQCLLHGVCPLNPEGRYVPGSWRPATWAAYLAFMAGYMWVAWVMAGRAGTARDYAVIIVFMIIVLGLSRNASGIVLLGAAMLVSMKPLLLSRYRWARQFFYPNRYWRMAAMAACVVPLLWIVFSAHFADIEPYTRTFGPLTLLSDKDSSMGSRLSLNQMSVSALRHEPVRWLIGKGWGGFSDVAFSYALVDGVRVYKNGIHNPNNLMVDGYSFHSHNQPLEALLSLGLPGLILWLSIPLVIIAKLPKRFFWPCVPVVVGLVWLSNVWFELAQCLPYQALALVALGAAGSFTYAANPKGVQAVALLAAIALGWSAWQQKQAMHYEMQLREAAHALPYGDYSQAWLESDIAHGGDRLRSSALFYMSWLALKSQAATLDDNDSGWVEKFMRAAQATSHSPYIGPSVASMPVRLAYRLLAQLHDPVTALIQQQVRGELPQMVVQLALRAPLRDDIATPFLLNLPDLTHGNTSQQVAILNAILAAAPDHRGALWVLGNILYATPGHEQEGEMMLRRTARLGVERIYPITDSELAAFK